jgi:hypothetical protein
MSLKIQILRITTFCDVMSCNLVGRLRCFGRTYCLSLVFNPENGRSKVTLNFDACDLYYTHQTKQVGLSVTLYTCIWELPISNLDCFPWFSSVHRGQNNTLLTSLPYPSKFFSDYLACIIPQFDFILNVLCHCLTCSLCWNVNIHFEVQYLFWLIWSSWGALTIYAENCFTSINEYNSKLCHHLCSHILLYMCSAGLLSLSVSWDRKMRSDDKWCATGCCSTISLV